MNAIQLRGVRTHNLRNIDLTIPYGTLVVLTGVSGSGKSSLAFDTLYAEGQRRYVESLSAYARQFLERMEKPDLDSIQGVLPSIAIEARNTVTNARSTVGTQTEVNDYLRLLFARIGIVMCPKCGKRVSVDTPETAASSVIRTADQTPITIGFPVFLRHAGKRHVREVLAEYERQGFLEVQVNGKTADLSGADLPARIVSLRVMIDTLRAVPKNKKRIIESFETAFRYGHGNADVLVHGKISRFSNQFACADCGINFQIPTPNHFSFNSPLGACPDCQGFGRIITIDWNLVVPDSSRSIVKGAVDPWTKPSAKREFDQLKQFCRRKRISIEKPFCDLSRKQRDMILTGAGAGENYFSVKDFFDYLEKKTYKMYVRVFLSRYRGFRVCPACNGNRLKPETEYVTVAGRSMPELCRMTIRDLRRFFDVLALPAHDAEIAAPLLLEIRKRFRFLDEVGLDYLTLDRTSRTLSGGEAQRIHLAASLGSALVDTLYVLDEPSIGLHERDNQMLVRLLKELRDLGNTVVVVEHDRTMIEAADRVIDLGPLGGDGGGEIIFSGSFHDLCRCGRSITAKYFRKELNIQRARSMKNGRTKEHIFVKTGRYRNLKNMSFRLPLHQLVVISGVSGSGKSTLLYDILYANYRRFRGRPAAEAGEVKQINGFDRISDMVLINQSPIGRTPRSNPATYVKVFQDIRHLFARTHEARAKRLSPGFFSFNVRGGRCEKCQGCGILKIEMHFLADVYVTCEACGGSRYRPEALRIHYGGKNIREILVMTVDEAVLHFGSRTKSMQEESLCRRICSQLSVLAQMGLGYLQLGQPATTLSGGEAQRLKLAVEMSRKDADNLLYLFDEPTTGLHYRDVALLLSAFDRILKAGHSVCVIEHNMEVIKCADQVIDLGPEGGDKGGEVVFSGSVPDLIKCESSYTGRYLKQYIDQPA